VLGRDAQLSTFDLLLRRISAGRTEQSMIITGLRGVGKTVLLGRFRGKAQELDWVVVEREVSKHDDEQFRRQMVNAIRTSLVEMSGAREGRRHFGAPPLTEISTIMLTKGAWFTHTNRSDRTDPGAGCLGW
jgi:ATP/maltotriose-dependent transcriptional regulator MalT